jgi:hypothetical protein
MVGPHGWTLRISRDELQGRYRVGPVIAFYSILPIIVPLCTTDISYDREKQDLLIDQG